MAKQIAIDIDITGTKDVLDLQKAIRNTKKELKETEDIQAYDNLAKDLVKLNSQLKEARKRQRQAVDAFTATDKSVAAYSRLSAQLRVARNDLKNLSAEGKTTGSEFERLTKEVSQLDTQLKDIDDSVGQANRKIGDYENAIRRATGLTEKQTGAFQRATGKLNVLKNAYKDVVLEQGKTSKGAIKLKKDIDKLERSLKNAGSAASKSGKRIGGMRTQLRGLGGPLAGLASGFLIFSELPQALSAINDGLQNFAAFISPAEAANRAFGDSIREGAELLLEGQSLLDLNISKLQDTTTSQDDRKAAINAINDEYGPYLTNLLTEESSLEDILLVQKEATAALIANIAAQQTAAQREKLIRGFAEDTGDAIAIAADAETAFGKTRDAITGGLLDVTGVTAFAQLFGGLGDDFTEISQQINETDKESKLTQIENLDKFQTDLEAGLTEVSGAIRDNIADTSIIAEKGENERHAAQLERARKQAERLAKQRAANQERFLQQEIKDANKRNQLLLSLSEKLVTAQLKNLEDGESKTIQLEQDASQNRIKRLEAQDQAFKDQVKSRIDKVNAAFKEGSKESIKLQKQLGAEQLEISGQISGLIEAEEIASLQRIAAIEEDFSSKALAKQKSTLKANLDLIKATANKVIEAKKKENEALAALEQERKEKLQEATQFALETTAKIIGAIDKIAEASSDKRIARVEQEEEERASNIEGLSASLQSASGLEKAFLEQQIRQETKAAEELATKKERIERDAAINNRAISALQAGINTALGVTQALASLPPPFSFIAAGITAGIGAAEIVSILAAPLGGGGIIEDSFARGGMVAGNSHAQGGVKFGVGGRVVELEGKEAVINKRSTAMFRDQLSAINVAGGGVSFANGGIISPPLGAPVLGSLSSDSGSPMNLLNKMSEMIEATNNRIDRIEVEYTTNTEEAIQSDRQDRKEIKTRSSL